MSLNESYTSTGIKFFAHQEVMTNLRNGKGQPVVTHLMLTDVCNHTCAFCSVQARAGDSLPFDDILDYVNILIGYGLKAVILSGGGNPILYRCKKTGKNFDDVVSALAYRGLEIGLITNGMPLKDYEHGHVNTNMGPLPRSRMSWKTVLPSTLDKLTWVRISMSGLDHEENQVFVPDVDRRKTALGFSYVAHDEYSEPADPHHGKVSRPLDLISDKTRLPSRYFEERVDELSDQFIHYIEQYEPRYLRLLPNCLEPELIPQRVKTLNVMVKHINYAVNREVAFVQNKPPKAPKACYLGYVHPVLAPSGYVMPCDSHCLNESAGHQLGGEPWRICHWSQVADLYEKPIRSLIADPSKTCPGCVFNGSNTLLESVVNGMETPPPSTTPEHSNFV